MQFRRWILNGCTLLFSVGFSVSYCSDPSSQLMALRALSFKDKVGLLQKPFPLEGVDLYDLIELDKTAYRENNRPYEMIKKACKAKQSALDREIKESREELEKIPAYDKRTVENIKLRILERQQKKDQIDRACAQLDDTDFRLAYDAFSLIVPEAALEAYEHAKRVLESKMLLSPETKILINDILGDLLSQVEIPGAATKLFNQRLAIRDLHVLPKPPVTDITYFIGFSGITEFNQFSFKLSAYMIWDRKYQRKWMIELETPADYKISDLLPSLKFMNSFQFPKSKIIVATFKGIDAEGFPYVPGFNFSSQWDLFAGPIARIFDNLKRLTSQALVFETRPVYLRGAIPYNPLKSTFESHVPVYLGLDFTKMKFIPTMFSNVFNKITSDEFIFKISPYERSPLLEAERLKSKLEEERDFIKGEGPYAAEWLEYSRVKAEEKKGEEIAEVEKNIKQLKEKAAKEFEKRLKEKGKSFPEKIAEPIYPRETAGIIEEGIQAVGTGVAEPLIKGVTELERAQKGAQQLFIQRKPVELPPAPPGIISSAVSSAEKLGFIVEAQTGIIIHLGTQREPIRLTMKGLAIPPGLKHPQGFVSLIGKLHSMIEFGWLSIGNASLSLDFDFQALEVLIALGIPISGVGIKGQVDLGKPGEARASLKAEGGLAVTSEFVPNIVFDVTAKNIRLADIVSYATYLATKAKLLKKEVPAKKIPTMTLHTLWGYASLIETRIGERVYRPGIGIQVETELFDKKAGFRIFMGDAKKGYVLEGFGYGPALSFSKGGKTLFSLYGEDRTKGPQISWNFNPIAPLEGTFGLRSTVDIPALAVSQKAFFEWSGYMITADFVSKFAGFDVFFKIDMNTRTGIAKISAFDERKLDSLFVAIGTVDTSDMRSIAAMALLREASRLHDAEGLEIADLVERTLLPLLPKKKVESFFQRARQAVKGEKKEFSDREKDIIHYMYEAIRNIAQFKVLENEIEKKIMTLKVQNISVDQEEKQQKELKKKGELYSQRLSRYLKDITEELITPTTVLFWKDLSEKISDDNAQATSLIQQLEIKRGPVLSREQLTDPYFKKEAVELDPLAKWRGLLISFGFAGDFSAFLSKQAAPMLRQWQEQAKAGLQRYKEQIAQWKERGTQIVNQEIEKNRQRVNQLESEIKTLQEECRKRPILRQGPCQLAIKKKQASVLKKKRWNATYLAARKKGYSAIAQLGKVWEVRYKLFEQFYKFFARGAELAAQGIDILNIKKAIGQYGFNDMITFKLPRLVELRADVKILEISYPITLRDLQFDFTKPIESGKKIVSAIMSSVRQAVIAEHLKGLPSLQRAIEDPFAAAAF